MAITANRTVKRQGRDGSLSAHPVAASINIYEGSLVYEDASGNATNVIVDQNTTFLGIAREQADNSSGSAGDIEVEVWTDGDFELPVSGSTLVAADVGKTAYGVDNESVSETASGQPPVGLFKRFISTSVGLVSIRGIGKGTVAAGTV